MATQTFFIFTPTWGDDPIWRAYFSNGLVQPPTSYHRYIESTTKNPYHLYHLRLDPPHPEGCGCRLCSFATGDGYQTTFMDRTTQDGSKHVEKREKCGRRMMWHHFLSWVKMLISLFIVSWVPLLNGDTLATLSLKNLGIPSGKLTWQWMF